MRKQVVALIRTSLCLAAVWLSSGCETVLTGNDPSKACAAGTVLQGGVCVATSFDTVSSDFDGVDSTSAEDITKADTTVGDDATGDTNAADTTASDDAACKPQCAGKVCGDDGCGGTCGTCGNDAPFCQAGSCVATCTPQCVGKACGDDGCGGSCGDCASGSSCNTLGSCVASAWTCAPDAFGGNGVCDCNCGAVDPDCATPGLVVTGCNPGQLCAAGTCISGAPSAWTCPPEQYADGIDCNCACGAPDPDCANALSPVLGCASGICQADGSCGVCAPDCKDNECGNDGCGGVCGVCNTADKGVCQANKCVEKCVPQCDDKTCGGDGCGGVCGTCKDTESCVINHCQALPPNLSCASENACGKWTTGGCGCGPDCIPGQTCCSDKVSACGCTKICGGKQCGEDGCGGSCGSCKDNEACDASGTCVADPCKPDPCGGKGLCTSGQCTCVTGFAGPKCEVCADGYTGFPSCKPDLCFGVNCGGKGVCDPKFGQCACVTGFTGPGCVTCTDGQKVFPDCDKPLPPCFGKTCSNQGVCDTVKDACVCANGFKGANCEACENPSQTWPQCGAEQGACQLSCNNKGACVSNTTCLCQPGYKGANCELCQDASKTWPECGGATTTNYQQDPSLGGVACSFCGVALNKASVTKDPTDQTPPTLKVLIPPAQGLIAPGMPIIAVVDDLLDPATITPQTFRVVPSGNGGTTIQGSIVAQVTVTNSTVLVFFPTNLNVGGNYKILIEGVKDKGGNPLANVDSPFTLASGATGKFDGNGSFESNSSGCFFAGDVAVTATSDNIAPTDGSTMLALSTANGPMVSATSAGSLAGQASIVFCGPLTVPAGKTKLNFDYNFASAEFDEYVGDQFDDVAIATVSSNKGGTGGVVTSVNIVGKTGIETKAYGLPGEGDPVAKMSGWKQATVDGVDAFGGAIYLTFAVADVADAAYTSIVTVDNVHFTGPDAVCGNAQLEGAEECDDKNTTDGDGCSKDCKIEAGYACSSTIDINTGSNAKGGQAAAGTADPRWETAIGTNWAGEGNAGDLKAVEKTPLVPPANLSWVSANVVESCVGSWAKVDPTKAAQWISTEGWDTTKNACKDPISCQNGQLYYYRVKFSMPNAATAAATSLQGKLWADNQITRIWINDQVVTKFAPSAPGASSFTGAGVDFAGWKGYFKSGENTLVVAVANFSNAACPNPQGLVLAVDLAQGSVCKKSCGGFGEPCCAPSGNGTVSTCDGAFACDAATSACKCSTGGAVCGGACCAAGEYCKAGTCEDPANQECLAIFKPGAAVLNPTCETAGTCSISCKAELAANPSAPSGVYLVKPDATKPAFQVQCDMAIDGGGWTLVGFEPAGTPSPANTTGIMAQLGKESPSVDPVGVATASKPGFFGPRFAYGSNYQEARLTWCTAAKAYRFQRFKASADLFSDVVANKPVTVGGGAGEMVQLSNFSSNDADLNKQLATPSDAALCRAYAGAAIPGDTSWAVKQKLESSNVCGCNSKGWQGTGSYYGGKGGGGNNDGCSSWGGGWAGTAGNGVQKGSVNTNTTFFWVR